MSFGKWANSYIDKYGRIEDFFECEEAWNQAQKETAEDIIRMLENNVTERSNFDCDCPSEYINAILIEEIKKEFRIEE